MSATIRLSKILVHTTSLAPLPYTCGPGHMEKRNSVIDCDLQNPQTRSVDAPLWLSELFTSIRDELDQLGWVIQVLMNEHQNPQTVVPGLVKAYNMLLQNQHALFAMQELQLAQRHDYFRFEAASKQFASEVQLALQYAELSAEQRAQEQGKSILSHVDIMASHNANQFAIIEAWAAKEEAVRKKYEEEQAKRQQEAENKEAKYNRELRRERE